MWQLGKTKGMVKSWADSFEPEKKICYHAPPLDKGLLQYRRDNKLLQVVLLSTNKA